MATKPRYRVFISYSHKNRDAFVKINSALEKANLHPWSDKDLIAGRGFTEQIQAKIAHSHLFVPILTPESHRRGWVHQEIGYAASLKVPCVPICIGKLPDGMIAMNHAVVLNENASDLEAKLGRVNVVQLVQDSGRQWVPPSGCAMEPEERAAMLEQFADAAFAAIGPARVRIQGACSSFSLPEEPPDHPVWKARYGTKPRAFHSCRWYTRERVALARHAERGGLSMILNQHLDLDAEYGKGVMRTRLCILVQFLESLKLANDKVTVALVPQSQPDQLVAVGDWFLAESLAGRPVRGVIHTVFTAHAPSVSRRILEFDKRLASLVAQQGSPPGRSKDWAIKQLRASIRKLPRHPAWSCDP